MPMLMLIINIENEGIPFEIKNTSVQIQFLNGTSIYAPI